MTSNERRNFLKQLAAGGLLLGVGARAGAVERQGSGTVSVAAAVNGWVRITPSDEVTLLTNTSEIGQGTGTALAQILAEELDLEWKNIRLEMAPVEPRYFNPKWGEYATYGSGGIAGQFESLRKAGAQARAMLIAAAADAWRVPATECQTENGQVLHVPSNRHTAYGDLAAAAARQAIPAKVALKPKSQWTLIGKGGQAARHSEQDRRQRPLRN
jgi:isoquinoline 1-oxidoreductase beta subunit